MKGVKAIGFAPFLASAPLVNTVTGVIDIPAHMTTPPAIARVEVKATGNTFVDTGTFDEATRTIEYVGVNTFFVPGNDIALRTQIQTDAGFLRTIFYEDYNGKIYAQGGTNGADVMTIVNGSDTQGWTITINSREAEAAYELGAAGIVEYTAALLPTT